MRSATDWIDHLRAWKAKLVELARRHWLLEVSLAVVGALAISRLEDSINRQVDQIRDPVLHEIALIAQDIVVSPLILLALLFCVLLVVSFVDTRPPVPTAAGEEHRATARPKRRHIERDVLWESNDVRISGGLVVQGPFCLEPCFSLLGTKDRSGKTTTDARGKVIGAGRRTDDDVTLWCPSCDKVYDMGVNFRSEYYAESVESIRDLVRAKFEAEIRRENEAVVGPTI